MLAIYKQIDMGVGTVIENNIKDVSTSIWNKVPAIPQSKWIDFEIKDYHKSFVNFAILFGIFAVAKTSIQCAKKLTQGSPKLPTKKQLLNKYGHNAWALITDVRQNEDYCTFLASNGFNLILMGDEQDIKIARDQIENLKVDRIVEEIPVNWREVEINLKFYEQLQQKLQHHDIAFVVLPKLTKQRQRYPTHLEESQPFQHIYLLVRYFGAKLKFRSYRSAIIFPSYPDAEQVSIDNGVSKGLIAGSDAFGRIIEYELKGTVQIVVARGSAQNAFRGLGNTKITY